MSDAQRELDALHATYSRDTAARSPLGGASPKLQDGRQTHAAHLAMMLAGSWCADPAGVATAVEALAPYIFEPKPNESQADFDKTMKKYARHVAKSATKKGTADKTREAVARQEAARELGAIIEAEADKVEPFDASANEAHAEAWAAWEASKGDPIQRVIEGIPPLVYLPGLENIIVQGSDCVIVAEYKIGKTFLSVAWVMTLALAGLKVLVVDFENGELQWARRVDEIVRAWSLTPADLEKIRANLDYREFPDITGNLKKGDAGDAARFAREAVCSDVVIFDSIAGLMERFGVEENDNDGAKSLHRLIMEPMKRAGTTVITLANSGHTDTDRLRGASGWLGAFECIYSLKGDPFSGKVASDVALRSKRSRYGIVGEWVWRMGGGTYVGPVDKADAEKPIPLDFKQQAERVAMRADKPLSQRALFTAVREAGVTFTSSTARLWLARLAHDPDSSLILEGDRYSYLQEIKES
jgi:hypothetical protein